MPRFAANLSMLFTEQDFLVRFQAAANAGFHGVEYLFPYDYSSADIKAQLDANKLTQVLFNLPAGDWAKGERGIACLPDRVEEFRAGVDLAIAYAQVLGNDQINCLAGIRPQGVDDATLENTFVANLKYAADKLQAAGIKLVMEAINTRDIPGFYLNNTRQALAIREKVASTNLFLQYDIYHMQIMEGDVIRTIEQNHEHIAHYHTAGNPGRNEIDATQELNYRRVAQAIADTGFKGYFAHEFIPKRDPVKSLGEAYETCLV